MAELFEIRITGDGSIEGPRPPLPAPQPYVPPPRPAYSPPAPAQPVVPAPRPTATPIPGAQPPVGAPSQGAPQTALPAFAIGPQLPPSVPAGWGVPAPQPPSLPAPQPPQVPAPPKTPQVPQQQAPAYVPPAPASPIKQLPMPAPYTPPQRPGGGQWDADRADDRRRDGRRRGGSDAADAALSTIAQGATVTAAAAGGNGGTAAASWAARAGGAALGGPVGGAAAGAVVDSFSAAARSLDDALGRMTDRLATMSAPLAQARAQGGVEQILGDLRRAQLLGNDLAKQTEINTRVSQAWQDAMARLAAITLPITNAVSEKMANGLENFLGGSAALYNYLMTGELKVSLRPGADKAKAIEDFNKEFLATAFEDSPLPEVPWGMGPHGVGPNNPLGA